MSEDPAVLEFDNLVADLGDALRERDEWKRKYEHAYQSYVDLNNGEFAQACEERDRALERLGPIDPGGSDRIDELESAMGFLRDELHITRGALDLVVLERDAVMAERNRLREALKEIRDRAGIEHMADIAREALAREDRG